MTAIKATLYLFSLLAFFCLSYLLVSPAWAQFKGVELATDFPVADKEAKNGDIVTLSDKGVALATVEADANLFGVITDQPVMVFRKIDNAGRPIVRNGVAEVNV